MARATHTSVIGLARNRRRLRGGRSRSPASAMAIPASECPTGVGIGSTTLESESATHLSRPTRFATLPSLRATATDTRLLSGAEHARSRVQRTDDRAHSEERCAVTRLTCTRVNVASSGHESRGACMGEVVNDRALDTIFREARTFSKWEFPVQSRLRRLWNITSAPAAVAVR